ncbi:MAG: hypothetical protein HY302_13815 [Opitutae bacterium]|nr:hypothetical protein [Opitutae bacterium]
MPITGKGQVPFRQRIRNRFGLKPVTAVEFVNGGKVQLRPRRREERPDDDRSDLCHGELPPCVLGRWNRKMTPLKRWALSTMALLAGCSSSPTVPTQIDAPTPSLASDKRLPAAEIQSFYSPILWAKLRGEPFKGFVVAEGDVQGSRFVARRILESYPDGSRNGLALGFLTNVALNVSTVGTNLQPKAMAYVVFYEGNFDGDMALIYAKQVGYSAPGVSGVARFFAARRY